MSGTVEGGKLSAMKNKKNDPNFYKKIGAIGGSKSNTGGFASGEDGRERARFYGAIGGKKSKRTK